MSRPRNTSRLSVAASAIALAITLVAVGTLALQTDAREVRALKNRGAIVAVTRGTEPLILGASWQKWLLRMFPDLQSRIGGAVLVPEGGSEESLIVWRSVGSLIPGPRVIEQCSGILKGNLGETMEFGGRYISSEHSNEGVLDTFKIEEFPRRGTTIHLRFQDSDGKVTADPEFAVPNPAASAYPKWTPDRFPAQVQTNDLEVICERLWTGSAFWDPRKQEWVRQGAIELRLREAGRPVAPWWRVEEVVVSDATGNRWVRSNGTSEARGDRLKYGLFGLVIPSDEVYRVRVVLARIDRFPPEDRWTIRGLPIPPDKVAIPIHRRTKLHGHTLEVTRVAGHGADLGSGVTNGIPSALVTFSGPTDRFCLRGRSVTRGTTQEFSPYDMGRPDDGVYLQEPGRDGKAALELIITPRREVEFLIRPTPLPDSPR